MLQRAASNAYSWWWASHIRTKQSKWLEQSLQDMGERVETVMKLIQEDGDTFARRAEMYYKKRPELISFVEESFRAYQSLAERYDHLSKELQNANSTLASAFPDQFQYPMDEDFDDPPPRGFKKFQEKPNPNIPKAPSKFPAKNLKVLLALTANKNSNDPTKKDKKTGGNVKKSDLTKDEAVYEIDKLQKQILTLQTEKEFAKSSYEKGYSKYWDIEEQIPTLQERISKLQDEFGITQAIKDEEARTLMAEAALKSCQQTLAQLLERQEKAVEEAKAERMRIREARERLKSLKGEVLGAHEDRIEESEKGDSRKLMSNNDEMDDLMDSKELEKLRDKIKEHFDVGPTGCLTVTEMAEKIDELVNKVLSLESSVSSQNAATRRLRSETDELNSQINTLEDDKSTLTEGKDTLTEKLVSVEKKLKDIQELNRDFEKENTKLETHFTEARSNLDTMSEKLHDVKPDDDVQYLSDIKEMKRKEKKEKKEKRKEKKEKRKMEKEKKKSDKHNSDASTPSEIEPEELKSSGSNPMFESDELKSSVSTTKEPNELESTSSIPSKNESTEIRSTALTPPEKGDGHVKNHTSDNEPKSTESDVAQLLEKSNKQEVDPVKPREPVNISKDDERKLTDPEEDEPIQANAPKDELALAHEVKPNEPVSKPRDEPNSVTRVQTSKEEDETDWRQLFMDTKEEYTYTLLNYKEAKKKICEMEQKTQDDISNIMIQLKELKNSNAKKDEELYNLRQKIIALQKRLEDYKSLKEANDAKTRGKNEEPPSPYDDDFDIKVISADEGHEISPLEEKLRADIDEILEENLDFWMRFSSSFAQIQKFQNTIKDLRAELEKLEGYDERKEGSSHGGSSHGGSSHGGSSRGSSVRLNPAMKSDAKPIYKHLREIQTELTVWMEQSEKLKDELQSRFTQLCDIEHDIKHALNTGAEDEDMKFTSFQAAKFQGEVANMQQENHKVADELQAGMDHITILQLELKRTVLRLDEELGFSGTQSNQDDSASRSRNQNQVPLRSFIFGVKPQKKKQSIFSLMHPAMMNKRSQHLKSDKSM